MKEITLLKFAHWEDEDTSWSNHSLNRTPNSWQPGKSWLSSDCTCFFSPVYKWLQLVVVAIKLLTFHFQLFCNCRSHLVSVSLSPNNRGPTRTECSHWQTDWRRSANNWCNVQTQTDCRHVANLSPTHLFAIKGLIHWLPFSCSLLMFLYKRKVMSFCNQPCHYLWRTIWVSI